ncbi:uncharacterized protein [Dysidea avara]|uniref:uncharacterized protein isoform X2 n=1 Tax=Dysidea avara TaxID=196820 RepID=UPI00331E6091
MDPLHHPGLSPPSGQLAPPLAIKQQTGRQQTLSLTNRGPEINRKRGRSASAAISGTCLQSHVHSPEKRRRLEANHRFAVLEHVPGTSAFQDGGAVHATCHPETGLVYGKDRPQRCLPNDSSGSSAPPPAILPGTSWRVDTISVPTIRALHRSLCIFEGNKAPCSVLTSAGNLSNHLFRRSTNSIPRQATAIRRPLNSVLAVHSSGVPDQPAQEYNRANPEYRVPWFCNRFSSDDSDSSSPQGGINPKGGIPDSDIGDCTDQDIGTPDWNSGSHEASNTTSPAPLPQSPGSKGPDSAVPQGFLPHHCPLVTGSTERSPVVGNSVAHSLLQQYCEDRSLCSDRIRCVQIRLGSHMPGSEHRGQVDCRGSSITYQLSRANSSIPGTTVFHQRSEQCGCADTDGQSDSNSSDKQDGRSNSIPTMLPSLRDLGMVPGPQHHSTCRVLTWGGQCQCRLGISPPHGQQRLATFAICFSVTEQSVGSIQCRPICQQDQRSVTTVLQLEAGPSSHSSGRLLSAMGSRTAISFPTIQFDWESSEQNSVRGSDMCMSCSTGMASSSLVSPVVEYVSEQPNTPSNDSGSPHESRPATSPSGDGESNALSRVACLRQGFAMQGFSERVTDMLLQSWRVNTHTSYSSAWKKWCGWCVTRQINPLSAPLADILEFLTDNFDLGLQYRTLNTLRSAISMTHARVDNCQVGTHPVVVRLLKGMYNARPPTPRYSNSWDVTPVVESLRGPSTEYTILQLAKKVATLMALSNADRCSDLAALDRDYMRWTTTSVQFTVVQLTKTRSSGPPRSVVYSALPNDPDICPVVNLRQYIERTTSHVTTMAPKPVFITSKRPFRRARPATLGHWIKDTLKTAGVDTERYTAHSTRSASTSQARRKGVLVSDILKVANWSTRSTFERFYHKPSEPSAFTRAVFQSGQNYSHEEEEANYQ